jgi:hypothetical protein
MRVTQVVEPEFVRDAGGFDDGPELAFDEIGGGDRLPGFVHEDEVIIGSIIAKESDVVALVRAMSVGRGDEALKKRLAQALQRFERGGRANGAPAPISRTDG